MEGPFSDKEKRFVLSEVLKNSAVPVGRIWAFISESNVEPDWAEILLPFGRNLSSCMSVWDDLRGGPSPVASTVPLPAQVRKRKSAPEALEPFQAGPLPKRRQSGADSMIRIQPRPSSNGSPFSISTPPTAQQPKKRGRPSKAAVEARNAAAIARGEVLPPPRTPVPIESMGGDASVGSDIGTGGMGGGFATIAPLMASGLSAEPSTSTTLPTLPESGPMVDTDASTKKKRGRPSSRSAKEPKKGEGSFSALSDQSGEPELPEPETSKPLVSSELTTAVPTLQPGGVFAPAITSGQAEARQSDPSNI